MANQDENEKAKCLNTSTDLKKQPSESTLASKTNAGCESEIIDVVFLKLKYYISVV